jgi:hypothetical protein
MNNLNVNKHNLNRWRKKSLVYLLIEDSILIFLIPKSTVFVRPIFNFLSFLQRQSNCYPKIQAMDWSVSFQFCADLPDFAMKIKARNSNLLILFL